METVGKALKNAVEKTFETLAFMEPIPMASAPDLSKTPCFCTEIEITAPIKGRMSIIATRPLLQRIGSIVYADMLPQVPDTPPKSIAPASPLPDSDAPTLDDAVLEDIIKELLNTLAGTLVKQLVAEEHVFSIGFPKTTSGRPPASLASWTCFQVDTDLFAALVELLPDTLHA